MLADQVKLVRVAGKEGEQVYIQIGDDEMEMLTQQQAEQVSCLCQHKRHTAAKHYL